MLPFPGDARHAASNQNIIYCQSFSLVNLESLKAGQKESKVQEQGISFPCPLFDTIERVVNFYTLNFLTPLGILCCFV